MLIFQSQKVRQSIRDIGGVKLANWSPYPNPGETIGGYKTADDPR